MMTLQTLVATMNQNDFSICEKMNIGSDTVIINQCDKVGHSIKSFKGNVVEMYSFCDRGLSKSRNNAIMRANADIVCLADDDMYYTDSYKNDILEEFDRHPDADAIIFNVESIGEERKSLQIHKFEKLKWHEFKEFGSVHIAFKREKVLFNNIWFNTMFGSGSKLNCGEDTIFLKDLIRKKFKIYKSPITIAKVDLTSSTWFNGYNEEHFKSKGALIAAIYPYLWPLAISYQSIKNSKKRLGSYKRVFELLQWYYKGVKMYRKQA